MRAMALAVLAVGCSVAAQVPASRPHQVVCRGIRVALPPSLVVLRATATELIAASLDLALIVTTDEPEPRGRSASFLIDQVSDRDHPGFMQAYRRVDGCTLRAVATRTAGPAGDRFLADVAGPEPEHWMIGSPRVPTEPALVIALRALDAARD